MYGKLPLFYGDYAQHFLSAVQPNMIMDYPRFSSSILNNYGWYVAKKEAPEPDHIYLARLSSSDFLFANDCPGGPPAFTDTNFEIIKENEKSDKLITLTPTPATTK